MKNKKNKKKSLIDTKQEIDILQNKIKMNVDKKIRKIVSALKILIKVNFKVLKSSFESRYSKASL